MIKIKPQQLSCLEENIKKGKNKNGAFEIGTEVPFKWCPNVVSILV